MILQTLIVFYNTSYLNKEAKCTEPSLVLGYVWPVTTTPRYILLGSKALAKSLHLGGYSYKFFKQASRKLTQGGRAVQKKIRVGEAVHSQNFL